MEKDTGPPLTSPFQHVSAPCLGYALIIKHCNLVQKCWWCKICRAGPPHPRQRVIHCAAAARGASAIASACSPGAVNAALQHMIEEFEPNWSSVRNRNMQPDPYLSAEIQEELLGIEDLLRSLMQETPSDDSVGHTLQRIAEECGLF